MLPNILTVLGSATLSATGTLIPSGVKGTGSIDTSQVDWLAVQFTFGGTATVVAEGSFDSGTTWAALPVVSSAGAVATSFSASGIWFIQVAAPITRLRVSAWTSGAVTLIGGVTDILNAPVALPSAVTLSAAGNIVGGVWIGKGSSPSVLNINSAATTNATSVTAVGSSLQTLNVSNPTATAAFLKLYDKASAPVVGTDTPVITLPVPANSIASLPLGANGQRFTSGIALALTGLQTDVDTTATVAGIHISGTYV